MPWIARRRASVIEGSNDRSSLGKLCDDRNDEGSQIDVKSLIRNV
jgi:hypothetical protein